ncbi:MAG: helix-turn-helix domain-containing protein [Gammaproteobacteria bacterium]|nr:helix-turn-helix domain-containing protein [Gammaproteobacteria bacterium]MBT7371117.1 helix-turn-helix domain-containing protein [Gammaproteobacteria bacterium]
MISAKSVTKILIVAVPETAGSALYGMLDVLLSAGNLWQTLVRVEADHHGFDVQIVSPELHPFSCGHGIPVQPHCSLQDKPEADVIIVPELWLGPDESIHGRYPALMSWLVERYQQGACIYSACSGAIMLAESGLLDGCEATSHWGYQDLFRNQYPEVKFRPEPNLVLAGREGRIVTAGGTTSWHDLVLHIIARHYNPEEALRIAKVYLLKWHDEGQLPFETLVRKTLHADSIVGHCEDWLTEHYREHDAIRQLIGLAGIPERSLKRRFKQATSSTLIETIQKLRIEEAKRMLETGSDAIDEISASVGYEDASFFRRLFKRLSGLTPGQYRKLFQPLMGTIRL